MSCMMPFIFCAPWLMPMANTRKGTRTEYGSSSSSRARQHAQLPHHRDQRAGDHQRVLRTQRVYQNTISPAIAAARRRTPDLRQAFDQVAHHLGEAGDVDVDAVVGVLGAQLFQLLRQRGVVEFAAGSGSRPVSGTISALDWKSAPPAGRLPRSARCSGAPAASLAGVPS
jgi:hypothetical protein